MNRTLKTFLLWLLISALPMQAFAVAISAACKPAHAMSGQTMAENSMSGHAMSEPAMAEHVADAPQNVDLQHANHQHATSFAYNCDCANDESCSACAAGCAASSAAVTAVPAPKFHPTTESFTARINTPGDGFIPSALERPPKRA
jgi:hypothetical protein